MKKLLCGNEAIAQGAYEWYINRHNMKELKHLTYIFSIKDKNIKKALKKVKPESFKQNWKIYNDKN